MLATCGIIVEECYTAEWRESKYTLIRLNREHRIRRNAFMNKMLELKDVHGIIGTEIFGFESVACNSVSQNESLFAHPGFKTIVDTVNKDISKLESWLKEGTITDNRKGLLWKFINDNPMLMTRAQLIQRVCEWGPIVMEHKKCEKHIETKPALSTHAILTKYRKHKPTRDVMKQVSKASKKLNITPSHDGSGEIYAAVNPIMQHLYKMGFTFKDAETRVDALQTAGVLEPFNLIRHAKVPDAR
jgi:hypothetical protein